MVSIAGWGWGLMRVFRGTDGGGACLAIEKGIVADSGVRLHSWLKSMLAAY